MQNSISALLKHSYFETASYKRISELFPIAQRKNLSTSFPKDLPYLAPEAKEDPGNQVENVSKLLRHLPESDIYFSTMQALRSSFLEI